jgi:beta-phosphoglucomutase family hydrolase
VFKGAIFDMDGVLVDNLECHVEAFKIIGLEMGYDLTVEMVRSVFGRSTVDMLYGMTGKEIGAEEGLELDTRKEEIYRQLARPRLREMMVPGLLELLEFFKSASLKMAVASSGPDGNVSMVLDGLGIRNYFSAVVTGSQVKKGKPDSECFLKAAGEIGIPPEECLIFEDSIAGIKAALASGGRCVALTTTHTREEVSAVGPHVIVRDFEEFMRLPD